MSRWIAVLALVASTALAGCGSDSESASPSACTEQTAREVQQSFITGSKFDVDCIKTKRDAPFYFVNNDDTSHTVTTDAGTPESFDAELPQKNSTFAHAFKATGTYQITCKRHSEKLTLFVY